MSVPAAAFSAALAADSAMSLGDSSLTLEIVIVMVAETVSEESSATTASVYDVVVS